MDHLVERAGYASEFAFVFEVINVVRPSPGIVNVILVMIFTKHKFVFSLVVLQD